MSSQEFLIVLSLLGTAVFAVSGALQGLRKDMDIVGVAFIACVTGVGGGTMRDLLLGDTPVGWVKDPTDIIICILAATLTILFARFLIGKRLNYLLWADAIGLALFAVLGALKATTLGAHPFIAILFGAMSATFGGIVRDIICSELPVVFKKEIYISAALVSAALIVVIPETMDHNIRIGLAVLGGFTIRALAMVFSWKLPELPK